MRNLEKNIKTIISPISIRINEKLPIKLTDENSTKNVEN